MQRNYRSFAAFVKHAGLAEIEKVSVVCVLVLWFVYHFGVLQFLVLAPTLFQGKRAEFSLRLPPEACCWSAGAHAGKRPAVLVYLPPQRTLG